MIEIIKTQPEDGMFQLFKNFIQEIYSPEMLRYKTGENINPYFLHACYMLIDDNKVCARAALYNNPYLSYQNKKAFCIGNYESVDDATISSQLISYIKTEAKENGAAYLIGPMNGSTWDNYRFSIHHNHPNFFLEPHHHLYYNDQFIQAGFGIISKYYSSVDTSLQFDDPDVIAKENEFKNSGVTFRTVHLTDYENELKKLHVFNAMAFKTNFLYTPVSEEAFMKKYGETKKFIDPDFVIFAEDEQQQIAGYFFCINDFYSPQKSLIIKTIARHPAKKWKGLGHVIANMIYKKAVEKNYKSVVHAFMNEAGTSVTISKDFYGDAYKNYVLYGKEV